MVSGQLYYYDPCGFRATLTLWSLLWFLGNYITMSLVVSGQLCYYDPCGFMATVLLWSLWFQGNYIIMILVVSGPLYYYDPCGFRATILLWSLWFQGNYIIMILVVSFCHFIVMILVVVSWQLYYYDPCCGFRATFSLVLTMGCWPARRPWRWWTWASPTLATSWWSRRACTDTRPTSLWGATAVRPARRCPRCTTLPSARPTPCSNPWRPASPPGMPLGPVASMADHHPHHPNVAVSSAAHGHTPHSPGHHQMYAPMYSAAHPGAVVNPHPNLPPNHPANLHPHPHHHGGHPPPPPPPPPPAPPPPTTTPCRTRTATRASWRCSRSASSSGGSSWASRRPTWARPWPTWRSPAWAACPSPPSAASSRWRSATTTWSPSSPSSWPGWTRPRGRLGSGRRRPERTGRRRGRGRPSRLRRSVAWKPTSPCSLARPGEKIAQIAEKLDLKKNVVRVWFCNQRQKQKRMKFSATGMGSPLTNARAVCKGTYVLGPFQWSGVHMYIYIHTYIIIHTHSFTHAKVQIWQWPRRCAVVIDFLPFFFFFLFFFHPNPKGLKYVLHPHPHSTTPPPLHPPPLFFLFSFFLFFLFLPSRVQYCMVARLRVSVTLLLFVYWQAKWGVLLYYIYTKQNI